MPQTSWHRFDLALDASRESGAGVERPLNQVSQIAVIVPIRTSYHSISYRQRIAICNHTPNSEASLTSWPAGP